MIYHFEPFDNRLFSLALKLQYFGIVVFAFAGVCFYQVPLHVWVLLTRHARHASCSTPSPLGFRVPGCVEPNVLLAPF